jgi:hypothetical protein
MRRRLEALKRIHALQQRLRDLSAWRVAALERERTALAGDVVAIAAMMGESGFALGATAAFGERHMRALEQRLTALAARGETERQRANAEAVRAKLADRAVETAEARYRAHRERRELADLIERSLRRDHSSSGQG